MELTAIESRAQQIADEDDRVTVEYENVDESGWLVYASNGDYLCTVDDDVLDELAESYDVYGVEVYRRDGSLWG